MGANTLRVVEKALKEEWDESMSKGDKDYWAVIKNTVDDSHKVEVKEWKKVVRAMMITAAAKNSDKEGEVEEDEGGEYAEEDEFDEYDEWRDEYEDQEYGEEGDGGLSSEQESGAAEDLSAPERMSLASGVEVLAAGPCRVEARKCLAALEEDNRAAAKAQADRAASERASAKAQTAAAAVASAERTRRHRCCPTRCRRCCQSTG